ncbi:MAG: ABC transporter ATP-binding protein/permease [Bacteroidales bacterium]|nr:ABC transporter ATP-binding protein/permease [Bacteroidales bacterium]MCM1422288.1 ABC transporter ATP-binding protein/permease [bacterium]
MIFGKHINRYYLKYGPLLLLGIAALIFVDYFQLILPELYRIVVNGMNGGPVEIDGRLVPFTMDVLLDEVCARAIVVILVMVVGRFLWRVSFYGAAIRVETDLRIRMFDHCKDLSRDYFQVNKVGNLMSLFTNDLDTIQECFGDGILFFCDALFLGLLAFYKMWRMDRALTGLSLIPLILLFLLGITLFRAMEAKWEVRQEAFSKLSDFSQENFSGLSVIKAFVKELLELKEFQKLNRENEEVNVEYTRISTLLNILTTLLIESVICVILGYGGYLVYRGSFNAGQLVEYIVYFNSIIWPVMAVSMLIDKSSRGKASLNRISELLEAEITVQDRPDVEEYQTMRGEIAFRHLSFRYPDGENDALTDVSFTIKAGESVGIVGRTGSGKTILVDLILRTYNVPDGTLFIDGRDVNEMSIRSLRAGCAYVPQDNFLFSDTIENNIAFAADAVDPAQVMRAAKLSDVHDDVADFTDGYQTVLGERGVTVSGGQKQRISIARALLKDAAILILDDSVSAVDMKTEKVILENLLEERKGKTTILIAHRISTVERMDKIIFVEDGRVEAVGSHKELCGSCEAYRRMVELQRLEEEVGGGADV